MYEIFLTIFVVIVITIFIILTFNNVIDDIKECKIREIERAPSLFKQNQSGNSELITKHFGKYLSLISIATAMTIFLIIVNGYRELLQHFLEFVKRNDLTKGGSIFLFFLTGYLYLKGIITFFNNSVMSDAESKIRGRAIVTLFNCFIIFTLLLNFDPSFKEDYLILKLISLSFVAGMGVFILFRRFPYIPLPTFFKKKGE